MKYLKTFESFIKESVDIDGFLEALQTEVEKAGGFFYDDENGDTTFVFAISKNKLSDSDVSKMFDSGKPAAGAHMIALDVDGPVSSEAKEVEKAVKALGLNVNVKNLINTYL